MYGKMIFYCIVCFGSAVFYFNHYHKYQTALHNGQKIPATVLIKRKGTWGERELQVKWQQKEYRVKVTSATYDSAGFEQPTTLTYDAVNDLIVDEKQNNDLYIGLLLTGAGVYLAWRYSKRRRNIQPVKS